MINIKNDANTLYERVLMVLKKVKIALLKCFGRITPKIFIVSFILAVIFTIFSPHWFIKTEFWQTNFPVPEIVVIPLEFGNVYKLPDGAYTKQQKEVKLYDIEQEALYPAYTLVTVNKNKIKYSHTFPFWIKNGTYKFTLIPKVNSGCNIRFPNSLGKRHKIQYRSIVIDGKECINQIVSNDSSYQTNLHKDVPMKMVISGNFVSPAKMSISKGINPWAMTLVFIAYWILFYLVITRLNTKEKFSTKFIKFLKQYKISIGLFIGFFLFYLLLIGITSAHINYFERFGVVFYGDANIQLMDIIYSETKRFHPYVFLPFYLIFTLLTVITQNIMLAISIIYAGVVSCSVMFLYRILNRINTKSNILNILLVLIFGFSYCCILSTYAFDAYAFTAFYLSIIIYLITKEIQSDDKSYLRITLIALLAALSFGVTVPNIITILILLSPLLFKKEQIKKFGVFLLLFVVFVFGCIGFKDFTSQGQSFKNAFYSGTKAQVNTWVFVTKPNVKNFRHQTLYKPITPDNKCLSKIFLSVWMLLILAGLLLSFSQKVPKADKKLFYSSFCALLCNFVMNYYWASHVGVLFAPNHFILWFILLGYAMKFINIHLEKYNKSLDNKYVYALLTIFIINLAIINSIANHKIAKKAQKLHPLTIDILKGE